MSKKYNNVGMNIVSALTVGDEIKDNNGRSDFRRKLKEQKDTERLIAIGSDNEFIKKRGLS